MTPTVLIVDDEEDVLDSTVLMVKSLGFNAVGLADPSRVFEVAETERPDVILQDLRMKGLNVAGLIAGLRSQTSTADIPIVFFSASDDIADTAARFDVWGYLRKPFSPAELLQVLKKATQDAEETQQSRRQAKRDVNAFFNTEWNLIAALNNYSQLLRQEDSLSEDGRAILESINDLILKLEANTDRLRSYLAVYLKPGSRAETGTASGSASADVEAGGST